MDAQRSFVSKHFDLYPDLVIMQDGIAKIVDPFVTKYNPLGHYPSVKTTFCKSFGDPEKLLQLRNQCDPYGGVFFDPSKANPRD
eukprot:scaffold99426_cov53-Attheya_sp.AAC.5